MAIAHSTKDVARKLGITAKQLRKHLRKHWTQVGVGGRYLFDDQDIRKLAEEMQIQLNHTVDVPGRTVDEVLRSRTDPKLRAQILKERQARQERLAKMIKESR